MRFSVPLAKLCALLVSRLHSRELRPTGIRRSHVTQSIRGISMLDCGQTSCGDDREEIGVPSVYWGSGEMLNGLLSSVSSGPKAPATE